LFNSDKNNYQELHEEIIKYMRFLKEISIDGDVAEPLINEWFTFHEVRQNWLGLSKVGNRGRGLGKDFAKALYHNLGNVFRDFGDEVVTRSSHLEKLCLIKDGVGRDNISDFTTNLIKFYLAEFTQDFAVNHLSSSQRRLVNLRKVRFNYDTFSWTTESFELPYIQNEFVLLTPKDILTKDEAWINRPELLNRFPDIADALPDATIRAQINSYLKKAIPLGSDLKKKEIQDVMSHAVEKYPEVIDYYIREKEDNGDKAVSRAQKNVYEIETIFIKQIREFVLHSLIPGEFYQIPDNTYEEAYARVMFLKDVIENKGGHKIFYLNGKPIQRESDLHVMYRLAWYATPSDVTREANDGRGPADFKVSRGARDKTIVEFKLAKNTQLERNLRKQTKIYEAASDATHPSIKAIMYFDDAEYERVIEILKRLNLQDDQNIILIDASNDNKPSGSRA
jgi:hypothetical protein